MVKKKFDEQMVAVFCKLTVKKKYDKQMTAVFVNG